MFLVSSPRRVSTLGEMLNISIFVLHCIYMCWYTCADKTFCGLVKCNGHFALNWPFSCIYIYIQEEQTSAIALASKMVEAMKFVPTQVPYHYFGTVVQSLSPPPPSHTGRKILFHFFVSSNWFCFTFVGSFLWRKWADPVLCYLSKLYCFQGVVTENYVLVKKLSK